uniref:Uncharacterized protein n=1 Tax=Tanacetum cinerariifolium TaxID=118510 RepID=A0A699U3W6_TANCI|nr:hypothetical protein [Tanacetum cinerariifolium]
MHQFAEDRKNWMVKKKKEEHSCLLSNRKFPPAAESRASDRSDLKHCKMYPIDVTQKNHGEDIALANP